MESLATIRFQLRMADGRTLEVRKPWRRSYLIGRRSPNAPQINDIFLDDPLASCRHCLIYLDQEGDWLVKDLGSAHGTRLQGKPVIHPVPYPVGADLRVGGTHIVIMEGVWDTGEDSTLQEMTTLSPREGQEPPDATMLSPHALSGGDETVSDPPGITLPTHAVSAPSRLPPATPSHTPAKSEPGAMLSRHSLFQLLFDRDYLDPEVAQRLLEQARNGGGTLFQALTSDRSQPYLDEIFQVTALHLGLELIAEEVELAAQALSTPWLPFSRAESLGMVMLKPRSPERNWYATLDPFDLTAHDWVAHCGGKAAERVLVMPDVFYATLRRMKNRPEEEAREVGVSIDITLEEEVRIRERVGQVDIPQLVNYLIHRAHLQMASDIHVEPTEELLVVRLRVDGMLHEELSLPLLFHPEVVSRLKIMSRLDVAEKRRPQDGRFGVMIRSHPIDVRVSSYPTVFGEKFVLRLLDRHALRPTIASLKMTDRDLKILKEKLSASHGLIVISGPTGSGKTTTLYSCLSAIDKKSKNVLTVEDPVEYRLKEVHQMQVNSKIGLDFASGLRTILRQDPDIIMVGEIRDRETAGMAVQAALTGHLVFTTIHAKDAIGVITRMLELGVEPYLLASALTLSIAQRLIRVICPHCRTPVNGAAVLHDLKMNDGVTRDRLNALGIHIDPHLDYIQGRGCPSCRHTGYSGRQPVFELFEMNEAAREMILDKRSFNTRRVKEVAMESGMTTLSAHGEQLVMDEVTTFSELIRVMGE